MKQPNTVLKMAVVASSVVLVTVFIAYRVGAFDRMTNTTPPSVDQGNTPSTETKPDGTKPAETILMPGSKSMAVPPPVQKESKPAQQAPTMMGGSKYAPVYVTPSLRWAVESEILKPPVNSQPPKPEK